ncbi:hypothetical protein K8I85_04745 [bacterium]|nr:hypothetical protein [bacterium]
MRPLLATLLIGLLATTANATPYWTVEDAEDARQSATGEHIVLPTPTETRSRLSTLDDFEAAIWFIASLQVMEVADSSFGGIREAEHDLDTIQTDNTSESIWMYSRYYELTGDPAILPHLAASWDYVNTYPAYNEEGDSSIFAGYYRYYNCGWAVRAGMKYEQVFGDLTHKTYVDSCADYLADHNLQLTGVGGLYDEVNPPVVAWGGRNLYAYAVAEGDSAWRDAGWRRGRRAKNWVDANATILGHERWAMSGGAVMWGVLGSYFEEFPDEEAVWLATHTAEMDTVADAGSFDHAWNGWYALGAKALEESTGDPLWGDRHQALADYLLAFDTDADGGIPANASDTDAMDQTWVTSYLGFMGLHPLIEDATSAPWPALAAAEVPLLAPNRPNPFRLATSLPFDLARDGHVTLDVMNVAGQRVVRLVDRPLGAGSHAVPWGGRDALGHRVASGTYFYRVRTDDGAAATRKMVLTR